METIIEQLKNQTIVDLILDENYFYIEQHHQQQQQHGIVSSLSSTMTTKTMTTSQQQEVSVDNNNNNNNECRNSNNNNNNNCTSSNNHYHHINIPLFYEFLHAIQLNHSCRHNDDDKSPTTQTTHTTPIRTLYMSHVFYSCLPLSYIELLLDTIATYGTYIHTIKLYTILPTPPTPIIDDEQQEQENEEEEHHNDEQQQEERNNQNNAVVNENDNNITTNNNNHHDQQHQYHNYIIPSSYLAYYFLQKMSACGGCLRSLCFIRSLQFHNQKDVLYFAFALTNHAVTLKEFKCIDFGLLSLSPYQQQEQQQQVVQQSSMVQQRETNCQKVGYYNNKNNHHPNKNTTILHDKNDTTTTTTSLFIDLNPFLEAIATLSQLETLDLLLSSTTNFMINESNSPENVNHHETTTTNHHTTDSIATTTTTIVRKRMVPIQPYSLQQIFLSCTKLIDVSLWDLHLTDKHMMALLYEIPKPQSQSQLSQVGNNTYYMEYDPHPHNDDDEPLHCRCIIPIQLPPTLLFLSFRRNRFISSFGWYLIYTKVLRYNPMIQHFYSDDYDYHFDNTDYYHDNDFECKKNEKGGKIQTAIANVSSLKQNHQQHGNDTTTTIEVVTQSNQRHQYDISSIRSTGSRHYQTIQKRNKKNNSRKKGSSSSSSSTYYYKDIGTMYLKLNQAGRYEFIQLQYENEMIKNKNSSNQTKKMIQQQPMKQQVQKDNNNNNNHTKNKNKNTNDEEKNQYYHDSVVHMIHQVNDDVNCLYHFILEHLPIVV